MTQTACTVSANTRNGKVGLCVHVIYKSMCVCACVLFSEIILVVTQLDYSCVCSFSFVCV